MLLSSDTTAADPYYSYELRCPYPISTGGPGTTAHYNLEVVNTGNATETVRFNVSESIGGWTNELSVENVTLEPREVWAFTLNVTRPDEYMGDLERNTVIDSRGDHTPKGRRFVTTTVLEVPDLKVERIGTSYSSQGFVLGTPFRVEVRVRNSGGFLAEDVLVRVDLAGQVHEVIHSFEPMELLELEYNITPPLGLQTLLVEIDPDGVLSEPDEEDNVASLDVFVQTADLEVEGSDITLTGAGSTLTEGELVNIHVLVHNIGAAPASAFNVTLTVDGDPVGTFQVDHLDGFDGREDVVFDWMTVRGNHVFRVKVNDVWEVPELRLENNEAWKMFSVNARPVAILDVSSDVVWVGTEVILSGNRSVDPDGDVDRYLFVFGDGERRAWDPTPWASHNYSLPGEYTVELEVQDDQGLWSKMASTMTINVERVNLPQIAGLEPVNVTIRPREQVWLDGGPSQDPDGEADMYLFDFGDGTNSSWTTESRVGHSYQEEGSYAVTLWVRDTDGTVSTSPAIIVLEVEKEELEGTSWDYLAFGVVIVALLVTLMLVALRRR